MDAVVIGNTAEGEFFLAKNQAAFKTLLVAGGSDKPGMGISCLNCSIAVPNAQEIAVAVLLMAEQSPTVLLDKQCALMDFVLSKTITQALRNAEGQADFDFESTLAQQGRGNAHRNAIQNRIAQGFYFYRLSFYGKGATHLPGPEVQFLLWVL